MKQIVAIRLKMGSTAMMQKGVKNEYGVKKSRVECQPLDSGRADGALRLNLVYSNSLAEYSEMQVTYSRCKRL